MAHRNGLSFLCSPPASTLMPWAKGGALLTALCVLVLLWGGAAPTAQAQPAVTDLRPENGTPNTQVRIYGSGFSTSGNNVVNIGGTIATVDSAKTTVLYVRVPSGVAGPAQVEVSSDGGSTFVTAPERLSVVRSGTGDFVPDSVLTPAEGGEVARGDVDGDGDIDLLVTGRDGGGSPITQLYVNDGSGSFTAASDGLPDLKQGTADFGDVDNDGDLDVLLTGVNASSTRVTRLFTKDDGSLSYTASGITFPGFQNGGTALGDVEGDGDLDIVLAGNSGGSATASLYTNQYVENGTLGFAEETGVSFLGTTSSTVDLGEFNGDGDLDVVITGQDGGGSATTTVYTNDGGGTSFTATSLPQAVQNGAVAVGDVDNNQTLDLVVSGNTGSFGSNATTLLFNDGTGSFTADQSLAGLKNGTATFGDVNADGNLDLLVTGQQGGDGIPVSILYQGDGTSSSPFSSPSTSSLSSNSVLDVTNSAAALVDVNGNGRLTPFLAGAASTGLTATLHRPVFNPVSSTPPPNAQSVSPTSLIDLTFNAPVADLTGLADSIAVRGTQSGAFAEADGSVSGTGTNTITYEPNGPFAPGEQVSVRLRPGIESTTGLSVFVPRGFRFRAAASAGPAVFPVSRTVSSSETEAREVATGFLTGDGNLDLVVTATGDDEVTLYPGNGDGTFASGTAIASGLVYARALALADVTGDGLLDVVVGEGAQGTNKGSGDAIRFYENQGSGSFGGSQTVAGSSVIDDVRDLAVADFDGNGTQDIVAVSANNNRVNVHLNDGGGASFTTVSVNQNADDPRAVTVTDVDFNGTPDLVVGSVSDDDISWYPNQGDGTFGSEKSIDGSAVNPRSVATADFDQDGRPEVLSAERGADGTSGDGRVTVHDPQIFNNSISWVENTLATTDSVLTAAPADVNADGLVDVVAGSVGGDSLVWYENTSTSGSPSFASGRALDTNRHNVQDVIAGDVDGDGSLDPVTAGTGEDAVLFYPNIPDPSTIYVDADATGGPNYGTSWNRAKTSLQNALALAEAGDSIWVAEGIYYPDNGDGIAAGTRDTSFVVTGSQDGLKIYGGFDGTESTLSSRDPSAHPVTLSGDVDGDGTLTGNSYHVLFFDGTGSAITTSTRLDGVTVTGGNANGSGTDADGGGLYCNGGGSGNECSPTLANVTFANNSATSYGGALYNDGTSGGISSPVLTDALFDGNTSDTHGGAVYNDATTSSGTSSPTITNTVFKNNSAAQRGGAVASNASNGTSIPVLETVFFEGNTAQDGGALHNASGSSPELFRAVFKNNTSNGQGGAIYNGSNAGMRVERALFVRNEALGSTSGDGGALYSVDSNPLIINAAFVDNHADDRGGAVLNSATNMNTTVQVLNATFTANDAVDDGGALMNTGIAESSVEVTNAILWDNTASDQGNEIFNNGSDTTALSYSIVQNLSGSGIAGSGGTDQLGGNLDQDPNFPSPSTLAGPDGELATTDDSVNVPVGSPAADAGTNNPLDLDADGNRDVVNDLPGGNRVQDNGSGTETVNMGAYETPQPSDLLSVTGTTPTRNATAVDTSLAGIDVTFNKTPDTDSVTAGDIRVVGDQTGPIPEADDSVGVSSNTLTYEPARAFQPGEVVTVSLLKDSVLATDGTTLGRTITFPFTAQVDGNSPGQFPVDNAISTTNTKPYSAVPADIGRDGTLDVVSAVKGDNTIAWADNDGTGTFSIIRNISTSASGVEHAIAADINGDDSLDVVSAEPGDGTIAWYPYDGAATNDYGAANTITGTAGGPQSVAVGDLDGDGDLDVVSALEGDNAYAVYENTDSGFQPGVNLTTSAQLAQFATMADLDGDGDLDVLGASQDDNTISWFANDGTGNFSGENVLTTSAENAEWVRAVDLNGDGALDVLSASHTDNTISWFENTGGGSFSSETTITTSATGAQSVAAGDLNGDGAIDVISAAYDDDTVAWYQNDGTGSFSSAKTITTTADGPLSVATGDLDGDGTLDVLHANENDDTVAWHPNTTIAPQVVTEAASDTTDDGFTAAAKINPGGLDTEVTVQYSRNGTFGTDSSATAGASPLTGDDTTSVSVTLSGLDPNTTYDYRVRAANNDGTTFGTSRSITTRIAPLQVTTEPPTVESDTSATLTGTVNPGGDTTRVYATLVRAFDGDSTFVPVDTLRNELLSDSTLSLNTLSLPPSPLRPSTEYRTQFAAANARDSTSGGVQTFVTAPTTDPDTTVAQRGGPRRLDVLANDGTESSNTADLDPSTVTVETGPAHGSASVDATDGSIRYEHDGSATTADTLTYTVANTAGQRSASTTVAIDVFDVQVQFGDPVRGDTVGVTLTVKNGFEPTGDTTFTVRKGGTSSYQELGLTVEDGFSSGTSGTVSAIIPDTTVTPRGVDYYALFSNGTDTLTVPAGGILQRVRQRPAHLPVSFEELSPPKTVAKTLFQTETYRMVSVPARLPTLKAAFERSDAYGPYDANEWRLERWNPGKGGYDSYPAIDSLRPGDGFWLTTRTGTPFTLPQGRTVEADTLQEIPLKAGWNQIGTPFGFAVPWDTVMAASGLSPGDIDGPVGYGDGGFVPGQDSLNPWKGYFLYNATGGPDTLTVPPVGQTGSGSQALTAKAGSDLRPEAQLVEAGSGSAAKAGSGRYTLQVQALSKGHAAEATLGLWPAAKAERGPYDHAQPPSVTGGLRLSALETIGGKSVPHSHSIKPGTGNGRSWILRLRALKGQGSQSAKLRLTGSGTLPDGHARYVLDLDRERRLTAGAQLKVKAGQTRRLQVIVGTEAYARKNSQGISLRSLETTLRANYPNPFDDKTTIEYVVAEEEAGTVTLKIYNVLGQQVETLVDTRKSAGVHQATWDGTNRYGNRVGSGVFFIRLRAGDVTETQKAVLVR